ncbi:MAG: hypothetical protein H6Q74_1931 [Firmicutes bacterium]|nr:hypothetical protein [Bacillota bacterium]
MLKRWFSVVIIISLLVIFGVEHSAAVKPVDAAGILSNAMIASGASVKEINISGWCKLAYEDLDENAVNNIIISSAKELGLKIDDVKITNNVNNQLAVSKGEVKDGNFYVDIIVEQIIRPPKSRSETYLSVYVATEGGEDGAKLWLNRVKDTLTRKDDNPEISTCLVGWLDGKLEQDIWVKKLSNALRVLGVSEAQSLVQSDFISITGYSPLLDEWLKMGDKPVNVNLAMRYSSYDDRTYVIIGSPVIAGEY